MKQALLLTFVMLGAALAGCAGMPAKSDGNTTTPTMTTMTPTTTTMEDAKSDLTFVAKQSAPPGNNTTYSFEGPSTAAAGWVTFHLQNVGMELHHMTVIKLNGVPYADFAAGLMPNATGDNMSGGMHMGGPAPEPMGGPNTVGPGQTFNATLNLTEGEYALVCFIPGADGMAHATHGMTKKLTVVKGTGAAASAPGSNATLTLHDFAFTPGANLTAGHHVIQVLNTGPHHHEAALVKLHENKTAGDFLAAFAPGAPPGPPPADGAGGIAPMGVNQTAYFDVDLTPGNYAFICFENDGTAPMLHAQKGMVLPFTVS